MKRIFVTGPDGLLGSNLVRELLSRGYGVKAMIQPGREPRTLEGLNIEKVSCDLLDANSILEASKDCDAIIHVAALTSVWPSRGDLYHKINVVGTRNVAQAALVNQTKRFIYVGSASSYGYGSISTPGNEDSPYQSAKYGLDYIDTKRQAQLEVMDMVNKEGLPAIVVNPTFMIGPYDSKPSSGAMIVAAAKGSIPSYTGGGKNWVAVKDVAHGICNALDKGRIGQAYILGGENLSYKDALQRICKTVGTSPPGFQTPNFLVKLVGHLGSLFGSLTGKAPKLSYPMAWISCDGHYFSPQKAIDELELPQTPLETAVQEAYLWFKENNYLNSMNYTGKVAIVTGSSMGIGKAISMALAEKGCKVVLNGRTLGTLEETAQEMKDRGYDVLPVAADISDWQDCQRLVQTCLDTFGRLDILVNNAGASTRGSVENLAPEVFQTLTKVNILGSIYPSKAALESLKESKGSIVFVSSIASFYGIPYNGIYSASKKALKTFSEAFRIEVEEYGVHVGIAYVGFTENDPNKVIYDADGQKIYLENREGIKKQTPDEVASIILHMIHKRKRSTTFSIAGKALHFLATFLPGVIKWIYRKNLPTIKEASSGTPRYVDKS